MRRQFCRIHALIHRAWLSDVLPLRPTFAPGHSPQCGQSAYFRCAVCGHTADIETWRAENSCAAERIHGFTDLALAPDAIRIGVLTDMSGPAADPTGQGSVFAAEMTIADFGGSINGKPI